jgi:hypothetical protein
MLLFAHTALLFVIAGLDPAIHLPSQKAWMPGSSPGVTPSL